ncbi:MAG: VCBS repeat-containing protein, partial [Deltaproteobacteria bacterium]|nr:VCBS repeat-containing protein [Deltaproteobacteria bacterium]
MKPSYVPRGLAVLAAMFVMSLATTAEAVPLFERKNNAFSGFACNNNGCWTNYSILVDINNDGWLDYIEPNYSGFFSQGAPQPLVVYSNSGNGAFQLVSQFSVADFSGRLRQVAFADVTGDGYVDMYAPDGYGGEGGLPDAFFINQGDGTFVDEADVRLPAEQAYAGAVRFGDLDGDGDMDIFVANGYALGEIDGPYGRVLINDGTGVFVDGGSVPMGGQGYDPDDVDLLDFDRDFDLDVLINMHSGKSSLWENDGAGNFTDVTDQWVDQPAQGFHYNPAVCDVDGDGDLDVWTDNMAPGYQEQLAINDGSGNFTDETGMRVSGNMSGADDNGVQCADVDGDGDFDAVIFNLFTGNPNNPRVERVLYNDGAGNFTGSMDDWDEFTVNTDATLWGDAADLDEDGRLDYITSQGETAGVAVVYIGNMNVPQDANPPNIIAVSQVPDMQAADAEPAVRFAVSDEVVS